MNIYMNIFEYCLYIINCRWLLARIQSLPCSSSACRTSAMRGLSRYANMAFAANITGLCYTFFSKTSSYETSKLSKFAPTFCCFAKDGRFLTTAVPAKKVRCQWRLGLQSDTLECLEAVVTSDLTAPRFGWNNYLKFSSPMKEFGTLFGKWSWNLRYSEWIWLFFVHLPVKPFPSEDWPSFLPVFSSASLSQTRDGHPRVGPAVWGFAAWSSDGFISFISSFHHLFDQFLQNQKYWNVFVIRF